MVLSEPVPLCRKGMKGVRGDDFESVFLTKVTKQFHNSCKVQFISNGNDKVLRNGRMDVSRSRSSNIGQKDASRVSQPGSLVRSSGGGGPRLHSGSKQECIRILNLASTRTILASSTL